MTEREAISIATALMKTDRGATMVNLEEPSAVYMHGKAFIEAERLKYPKMDLDFEYNDYWLIEFPFKEVDRFQRTGLAVTVDLESKEAKLLLDL